MCSLASRSTGALLREVGGLSAYAMADGEAEGSSECSKGDRDFDEEARRLFRLLNLPESGSATDAASRIHRYHDLDAVWTDPLSGGKVFIGNQTASRSRELMRSHGVNHIVNCTSDMEQYFQDRDSSILYYRFDIYKIFRDVDVASPEEVLAFFMPVFNWIDAAVSSGGSVLVHCLAGAHRAGTTGVAYTMHASNLDHRTAIAACKACRPIVDPIGNLTDLLRQLDNGRVASGSRSLDVLGDAAQLPRLCLSAATGRARSRERPFASPALEANASASSLDSCRHKNERDYRSTEVCSSADQEFLDDLDALDDLRGLREVGHDGQDFQEESEDESSVFGGGSQRTTPRHHLQRGSSGGKSQSKHLGEERVARFMNGIHEEEMLAGNGYAKHPCESAREDSAGSQAGILRLDHAAGGAALLHSNSSRLRNEPLDASNEVLGSHSAGSRVDDSPR
eukprot:TRINITY_DN17189_c0_g1_i1.p1 TRINITY_DN17189_c0_g1~~TRINITY_DN17189_c0_g1_i1.p1  ORF type:complete len:452 (-),score=76.84 TRINITY_DN17189_c0_g1_i1:281-1636(-)